MQPGEKSTAAREILAGCTAFFTASFLVLFMAMPRDVGIYDESLVLTGAMRILAGQIHIAISTRSTGLQNFIPMHCCSRYSARAFSWNVLFSLVIEGLTVASVYGIAALYCRKWIAAMAAMVTLFWLYGLPGLTGPWPPCPSPY